MKRCSVFQIFLSFLLLSGCEGVLPPERSSLRPPAYPVITIDPYTDAWSVSDNLYGSTLTHWTGQDMPLLGTVSVDGTEYRFMGDGEFEESGFVPCIKYGDYWMKALWDEPYGEWTAPDYKDEWWPVYQGPVGTSLSEKPSNTNWNGESGIWIRRHFNVSGNPSGRVFQLEFTSRDAVDFHINGIPVYHHPAVKRKGARIRLSDEAVAAIREGDNVLAVHSSDTGPKRYLDFGITERKSVSEATRAAVQDFVDVQAMQTHYGFTCGPVRLLVDFTAPLFPDDLDLLSRPVNYMTYRVSSLDGAEHSVSISLKASPRWAVDSPVEDSEAVKVERGGMVFMRTGSVDQNVLGRKGDDVRINWGWFMIGAGKDNTDVTGYTVTSDLGTVGDEVSGHFLIGYDDVRSIQYFGKNLRAWWNDDGTKDIYDAFYASESQYERLIDRCNGFDRDLFMSAKSAGGRKYAELCALAYRQAVSAHKLVRSPSGLPLLLSKENNSNGSIGTVDVSYPSSPLFLYYNPVLAQALINPIFEYCESERWTKPYPAHDLGTYPLANGQTYMGEMPVEEAGNMIILCAAISVLQGNADYARLHWDILSGWADYLVRNGLDPEDQLCTDDFAGHSAHNANLSIKAILGVASYARMAQMLGNVELSVKYMSVAREMASKWKGMAFDGGHYRLCFDREGSWSQKYNLVWDKLLGLNVFDDEIASAEVSWYLTQLRRYGLPLDNRETYTKSDWTVWTATLAEDREDFEKIIGPMYDFYDNTVDRVPMSDWYYTDSPHYREFIARSVVGGYFMKLLAERMK